MATCRQMVESGALRSGQAVRATHQVTGRGRGERVWLDVPDTAVLMTTYNDLPIEPANLGMLAILAAVVVADVIADLGVDPKIKWPNDILLNDRKCAGILISTRSSRDLLEVFAGFGLNVNDVPTDVAPIATSLYQESGDSNIVASIAASIHATWNQNLASFLDELNQPANKTSPLPKGEGPWVRAVGAQPLTHDLLIKRWMGRAAWIGAEVTIQTDEPIAGTLLGIDTDGRLVLDTAEGRASFTSGDVTRGPRVAG